MFVICINNIVLDEMLQLELCDDVICMGRNDSMVNLEQLQEGTEMVLYRR
uniref:Uncharacterized protein n=1 Tax=Arion vulgaris TaxID=1028688 RepID=A0A0B6ZNP1_9EUPU